MGVGYLIGRIIIPLHACINITLEYSSITDARISVSGRGERYSTSHGNNSMQLLLSVYVQPSASFEGNLEGSPVHSRETRSGVCPDP